MFKKILTAFFVWKVLIYCFVFIATFIIPFQPSFTFIKYFGHRLPYFLWVFGNFDGVHYINIAKNGYSVFEYPFFPLYPIFIWTIKSVFEMFSLYYPSVVLALLVSHVVFFIALIVVYKILILDKMKNIITLVIALILFFPTSVFYGAAYNDSLFFLLATMTIYFARRKSWAYSCILAALATLARLNGLGLVFFILLEYLTSSQNTINSWRLKKIIKALPLNMSFKNILSSKIFLLILIPSSFIGYLTYIQNSYGNWAVLFSSMQVWNQQHITFPLQVFWRYLKIIFLLHSFDFVYFVALLELLFVIFYIFVIFYSYKKIRLSYWVFIVVSILIPSLTGTFQGMPRYGLHIYPLFLAVALLLREKNLKFKLIYFAISILLMFIFTGFFTRGYFVA